MEEIRFLLTLAVFVMTSSYGDCQITRKSQGCDTSSCVNQQISLSCPVNYKIAIDRVEAGFMHDNNTNMCCGTTPLNPNSVCHHDEMTRIFGNSLSSCIKKASCSEQPLDSYLYDLENCSSSYYIAVFVANYICVNSSQVFSPVDSLTKTVSNEIAMDFEEKSAMNINGSFVCTCDIGSTTDSKIFVSTNHVNLQFWKKCRQLKITGSGLSVTIPCTRDASDKYRFFNSLGEFSGPIRVQYNGSDLGSSGDEVWMGFKAAAGQLRISCGGCQPEDSTTSEDTTTTTNIPNIPGFNTVTPSSRTTRSAGGNQEVDNPGIQTDEQPVLSPTTIYVLAGCCTLILALAIIAVVICKVVKSRRRVDSIKKTGVTELPMSRQDCIKNTTTENPMPRQDSIVDNTYEKLTVTPGDEPVYDTPNEPPCEVPYETPYETPYLN